MERVRRLTRLRPIIPARRWLIALCCLLCAACGEERGPAPTATVPQQRQDPGGCLSCHQEVAPDPAHALACTTCHGGDIMGTTKETAHAALIARPAAPLHAPAACGPCHGEQTQGCEASSHYTLRNEISLVRRHFGLPEAASPRELKSAPDDASAAALVDDLLRRHCLRCHVHGPGDDYPLTRHALGCGACHLERGPGREQSHVFLRHPGDHQCLACHRGAFIGADYHGLTERDTTLEFRTPYAGPEANRDAGVERHRLTPDVHQQAGISCIDCHGGKTLMAASEQARSVGCRDCHDWRPGESTDDLPDGVRAEGERLLLLTRLSGRELEVPRLMHPAHARYGATVDCAVCHARWGGNDQPIHLLRREGGGFDFWFDQATQGNSNVERFLRQAEAGRATRATAPDRFTGEPKNGIWLQGFGQRRWEDVIIRRDQDGVLRVFRPLLDLRISAVDGEGRVLADNLRGTNDGYLPFSPHTIGRAGAFHTRRLRASAADQPDGQRQP